MKVILRPSWRFILKFFHIKYDTGQILFLESPPPPCPTVGPGHPYCPAGISATTGWTASNPRWLATHKRNRYKKVAGWQGEPHHPVNNALGKQILKYTGLSAKI